MTSIFRVHRMHTDWNSKDGLLLPKNYTLDTHLTSLLRSKIILCGVFVGPPLHPVFVGPPLSESTYLNNTSVY